MSVCTNLYMRRIPGKYHVDPITNEWTDIYPVPCNKCTNCKIQIAKEWALRCCLELPYWDKAIFTTLTYRDSELPKDFSIHKRELENFFHDLRNDCRNRKIKFLASGEYGDKGRPHYHAIIFGIGLSNEKRIIGATDETFNSENSLIEKNWTKGNVFNGAVTYNSCRYTASYVFKKYYDELKEEIYTDNGLEVPFQKTSNGLGKQWYLDYGKQTLERGYIMFNGIKHTIPRYFLKLFEKDEKKQDLKKLQIDHAEAKFQTWYENYIQRLAVELCEQPDEINAKICGDDWNRLRGRGVEFQNWQQTQNEAKAKHAEERNRIFFGG